MSLTCRTCFQLDDPYVLDLIVNNKCARINNPCVDCRVFLLRQQEMPLTIAQSAIREAVNYVSSKKLPSLGIVLRGGDVTDSFELIRSIHIFAVKESPVPVNFLLDGCCGECKNVGLLQWTKKHGVVLISNWTHELIGQSHIVNNDSPLPAYYYVGDKSLKYIADDVIKLYSMGFNNVAIRFLNVNHLASDSMGKKIVKDEIKRLLEYCKSSASLSVNLFDMSIKSKDFNNRKSLNCQAGDSCVCVDMDGATYPCVRLSPMYLLRSISNDTRDHLNREFIERNGERCYKCKIKSFCSDCLGDFLSELTGCEGFPNAFFSDNHCWLAKCLAKSTFLYGMNLLEKENDRRNPILIRNLDRLKEIVGGLTI